MLSLPPEAPRRDVLRLRDILEAARLIDDLLADLDYAQFETDSHRQAALMQYIGRIGECAAKLDDQTRSRRPELPWAEMRGMRNLIVHVYWRVDPQVLWRTARQAVPAIVEPLRSLVHEMEKTDPPEETPR